MGRITKGLVVGCVAWSLAGCGSTPVYEGETFNVDSPYQRQIPTELEQGCEGARLALLSQGYAVDDTRPHHLSGTKAFQPDGDEHVILEIHVTCALTRQGTTLYVNAVESRYELKTTQKTTGFSLPSIGSLKLPWGSSSDALVKVSGETIKDLGFYERYFDLVERQLGINAVHKKPD